MQLCSCGFANADEAASCVACGRALTTASSSAPGAEAVPGCEPSILMLENARGGTISIPAPGGLLGRAGDFEPDFFSPRVSGVHALVACDDKGRWTIEHLGRNGSSVERGGVWITLRTGKPQPLFGGETLKLADMVFRVSLASAPTTTADNAPEAASAPPNTTPGDIAPTWSVRCPVCGTEHAVTGPDEHIAHCSFCQDPLDARQIARIAPRALPRA